VIRTFAVAGFLFVSPALAGAAKCSQDPVAASPQTQNQTPTAPQAPAPNSTKPKPKKVWTNENVADSGGSISVVGSAGNSPKAQPKPAANTSIDPKVLTSLRDQLQRLQAQLNIVDRELSDLKALSKGDSKHAGGLQTNTWQYNSSSVEEQIRHLQEKKKRLEATIDELLDAARKAGIEPGQLR
jgi:hypothetical protein